MHGAGGGHKAGPTHPAYKHGLRARAWIEMRKEINDFARFTAIHLGILDSYFGKRLVY
jgi:hypothetical protein